MNRTKLLLALCMSLSLASCWNIRNRNDLDQPLRTVWGYRAVYSSDTTLLKVATIAPQPIEEAGKIFVVGNLIFQNEQGKGLHVLDKTNPAAVVNKGFIQIRGNTEVTLKGTFLYANSFTDLLVIDIKDWQAPVEVKKIKKAFLYGGSLATNLHLPPPQHGTYYSCVSNGNGVHIGWVQDSILANCYYN